MPCVSDSELAKALRQGDISRLYYFYGKDIALIEAYQKKLISKLLNKEQRDLNYHFYEGKSLDLSVLYDDSISFPMFSDYVCIVINDLNADNLNQSDIKYLLEIIEGLPSSAVLIIYQTSIDITAGKKYPSAKNKKIIDACAKIGYVCEFNLKSSEEQVKYITQMVEKNGSTISKKSAVYLSTRCLNDTLTLNNEIKKLCDYSDGKEITNDTIDLLVARMIDTNAFALAKAVTSFNAKKSMEQLDELYSEGSDSISICGAISMAFIDLYRARVATNEGISQQTVINDFSYRGREFAVKNAFRDCKGIELSHLKKCISILSQTDIELKSLKTDGRILIEKAIAGMLIRH